ncbi:TonB-dependent receptor [Thiohalobacter sp. IOR34]|uniref:TonB-dependent receptor n=1 Tax=Thiohalobacter sp. IOR34 TaxID=3057176 RepID=UPI0025B27FEC|nr:TonB-dependent receptor [Thiohalobacter sp. IOR34]WJW75354.1 TonB-dependent receptor [Thiohalobacter sp. IOR34]
MNHKAVSRYVLFPVLSAGVCGGVLAGAAAEPLPEIAVTATREAVPVADIPATIDAVDAAVIDEVRPAHPGELLLRIPGVHVNVTNGEGHMTAIRQPITTKPMYLYLEDGIPTRSTGFFNHNALYEVNVPQADRVEVLKGPGTALYGSDAIGAVINVMTRPAPEAPEAELGLEGGGHGWARLLASGGTGWDSGGVRADLNLSHTDGWRDATDYDRQSATLRWDAFLDSGATLKTVLALSNIDQQTAGSSRLLLDDYHNNPTLNYTPISYREVQAARFSVAWEKETSDSLLSVTPYLRHNVMELLPNWSLSYDPTVYETRNDSFGVLVKYRRDLEPMQTRVIVGLDVDYSPGGRTEHAINPTLAADGKTYVSYTLDSLIYDYDVSYRGISPYAHVEFSPLQRLRVTAGLRYDNAEYDYDNKLGELTTGSHRRPASTRVDFDHLSPKLGATWRFNEQLNGFVSYRHAFRVPSESQLFRQGRAENTVELEPIKVDSYEIGVRGRTVGRLDYELSVYRMSKKDDILTYRDPVTSARLSVNAGETLHRGVELRLARALGSRLNVDVAASYAKHTYEEWSVGSTDFSGKEMESAPRLMASARLDYRAAVLNDGRVELEVVRLGEYWMDQANTYKYKGHSLLNLRLNYPVSKQLEFHGRVMNLTDQRYATTASYKAAAWGRPERFEYSPGLERTLYLGLKYRFL